MNEDRTLRRSEEWLAEYLRRFEVKAEAGSAVQAADMEQDSKHAPSRTDEDKAFHPRFRLHIHSKRRRLADPDGISAKAAIDGLAKAGLFADDSADWIQSVSFSQEISKKEETIIEVWEVK